LWDLNKRKSLFASELEIWSQRHFEDCRIESKKKARKGGDENSTRFLRSSPDLIFFRLWKVYCNMIWRISTGFDVNFLNSEKNLIQKQRWFDKIYEKKWIYKQLTKIFKCKIVSSASWKFLGAKEKSLKSQFWCSLTSLFRKSKIKPRKTLRVWSHYLFLTQIQASRIDIVGRKFCCSI